MTDIAETLALVLKKLQKLEDAATAKKIKVKKSKKSVESDDDTPKKPLNEGMKAWQVFVSRVRGLMKEMDMGFSTPVEVTQFCSALKAKNSDYGSWSTEDILEERESWEKPEKSKQEIAGKNSKKTSAASSVAAPAKKKALPVSDAEDSFSDNESEDEPEPEPEPVKKVAEKPKEVKKAGRPKKLVDEASKEDKPKEVKPKEDKPKEVKKAGRPKKVKDEDENYSGGQEAFKHKGIMYTKTERHDVIDEDECVYVGRWNEDTNEIDTKFPEPSYVKKLIAAMNSDDE